MSLIAYFIIICAYLLGSISSAVLFCRLAGLPDPRTVGSHNAGATNVLRIGGKLSALGVLLFDILKGALPIAVGFRLHLTPSELGFIAVASCLGHIFPLFFQFRGGKGVATAFGAILLISYTVSGIALLIWLGVLLLSGYASLSAVITALILPSLMWWFKPEFTFPVALVCCLLLYRHHDNIQRLWRGLEEKIWRRKPL